MTTVEHYAVVKCACGAVPPDTLSDVEACLWLTRHIAGEQYRASLPVITHDDRSLE